MSLEDSGGSQGSADEDSDDEVEVPGARALARPGTERSFRALAMGESLRNHESTKLEPKAKQHATALAILNDFLGHGVGVLRMTLEPDPESKGDQIDHIPSVELVGGNSLQLRMMVKELGPHMDRAAKQCWEVLTDRRHHEVAGKDFSTLEDSVRRRTLRARTQLEGLLIESLEAIEERLGKNRCMDMYKEMEDGKFKFVIEPEGEDKAAFGRGGFLHAQLPSRLTMSQLIPFRNNSHFLKRAGKGDNDHCLKDIVYYRLMALTW